jgi:hypothetical protein
MALQFSVAVRNARLDAIEAAIGATAKLRLYSGAPPVNCAAAATGTLLAEWTLAADWSVAASGGTKTITLPSAAALGLAAGTVGHYRLVNNAGSACGEQGTVTGTGGGGDATMDNLTIAVGQPVNLTSWTWTEPGA